MKRNKAEQEKRNKIFVGIIITVFMVSSIAGVVLYRADNNSENQDKFTLNISNKLYDFTIKRDTNMVRPYYEVSSDKGKTSFIVFSLPQEISNIVISNQAASALKTSSYFFLTFNPEDSGLRFIDELRFNMRKSLPGNWRFLDTVTNQSDKYLYQIIDCNNATIQYPVIFLKTGNVTNISVSDNCVNFEFAPYDMIRVRDLWVYLSRGIDVK